MISFFKKETQLSKRLTLVLVYAEDVLVGYFIAGRRKSTDVFNIPCDLFLDLFLEKDKEIEVLGFNDSTMDYICTFTEVNGEIY